MPLQWEGKIGPAAVIGIVQVALWAVGGIVVVERMQDGIDTAKQQIVETRAAIDELRRSNQTTGERVTRIEAQSQFVEKALERIEKVVTK